MAVRLHPGVYVEERSSGVRRFVGVSTSTAAFVGEAARGVPGRAGRILATNFADFIRAFGGHSAGDAGTLPLAVEAFFRAGGRRAYVCRALPADATVGAPASQDGRAGAPGLRFIARGPGAWSERLRIRIDEATNFPNDAFRIEMSWVESGRSRVLEVYDDVRMDPTHEDYAVRAIAENSRYVEAQDLFVEAVADLGAGDPDLVPAQAPVAVAPARSSYVVYEGARLTFQWNDENSAAEPTIAHVTFDEAAVQAASGAGFAFGRAELEADALADLINDSQRDGNGTATFDFVADVVDGQPRLWVPLLGQPAQAVMRAAAGSTFDLRRIDAIRISLTTDGGAPVSVDVALGGLGDPSAASGADLVALATPALAGAGDAALQAVVARADEAGSLRLQSAATAAEVALTAELVHALVDFDTALDVTANDDGDAGTISPAATLVLSPTAGATYDLSAGGTVTIQEALGGGAAADVGVVNIAAAAFPDDGAVTAAQLAAAIDAGLGAAFTVAVADPVITISRADQQGVALSVALSDPALGVASTASDSPAGTATAARMTLAPEAGATYDLSAVDLQLVRTVAGVQSVINIDPAGFPGALNAVTGANMRAGLSASLGAEGYTIAGLGGGQVQIIAPLSADGAQLTLRNGFEHRARFTARTGESATDVESLDAVHLTITETLQPSVPPILRNLGLPARSRGYEANSAANPLARPAETGSAALRIVGGTDGLLDITAADLSGDALLRTGLHAFDDVDVNLVVLPGRNDEAAISAGMAYCDRRGDCFYIADGPGGAARGYQVLPADARQFVDGLPSRSDNAAMYFPWIEVSDPVGIGRNPTRWMPPSGHIAGVYARTDGTRGVWKAPAGLEAVVTGALDVQYAVSDAEQDVLNPAGLDVIRQFPGSGIVVWGARTLSSDPEWRYVPVRRTMLFIKESLRRGLQWAVFEPNAEELWARIRSNIAAFMLSLYKQGAFQGATAAEAFEVICDRSTNPQELVDQGIVTAEVRFAPVKPAEFVVIQISQKTLIST